MLNKVCIMGRLVRDPELRRTQAGIAVTTMRIAVDRDFKSQDGTKQADFFDVVAWRGTAEFVSRYFSKGRMMVVEGRLQTRDWTDREGNKRINTEIVADNIYFGDSRRDGPNGEYGGASNGYGGGYGGYGSGANNGFASSNPSGGYGSGASNGFASSNPSGGYGGYGSGYASGGAYGSGPNNGFASANPSGGYGSGYASGGYSSGGHGSYGSGYGGYGSGGFGAYDTPASPSADASSGADNASGAETPAPAKESAPASDSAPSSFAEVADDDGDLPF